MVVNCARDVDYYTFYFIYYYKQYNILNNFLRLVWMTYKINYILHIIIIVIEYLILKK